MSATANAILLRRQLAELTKHPVDGFSAGAVYPLFPPSPVQTMINSQFSSKGLVDDSNMFEWEVMIIG